MLDVDVIMIGWALTKLFSPKQIGIPHDATNGYCDKDRMLVIVLRTLFNQKSHYVSAERGLKIENTPPSSNVCPLCPSIEMTNSVVAMVSGGS